MSNGGRVHQPNSLIQHVHPKAVFLPNLVFDRRFPLAYEPRKSSKSYHSLGLGGIQDRDPMAGRHRSQGGRLTKTIRLCGNTYK